MPANREVDRAIVVGISSYPQFGLDGTSSNDLQGPVKDANAMADWLVNEANAHVTLITSTGRGGGQAWTVSDRPPRPNSQDITDGFVEYIRESLGKSTARLGKRLYVYMAGHGFSPQPRHLALITADALSDVSIPNVQATSWIDWFADQLYFDECVLWMDCCATRTFGYEVGKPLMKQGATRQDGRAKVFMGFAAGPSLSAFEGPIPPAGEIRGLFTDKLLRGLKGAAAGASGTVRTSDLVAYMKNQKALVGDQPVSGGAASLPVPEPVFPETAELVLAEGIDLPSYDLRIALADGTSIKIVEYKAGQQQLVNEGPIVNGVVRVRLGLGLYKAIASGMPDKLFEIASGTTGEVNLA
jgi:hypothetical protein